MKRIKHIFDQVCTWENLYQAYKNSRSGKQSRPEVARFTFNLEYELRRLQTELREGTYLPGAFRQFTIYDRKPRVISVAPFRDRVLQHAVMDVLEPLADKKLIYDSYACRANKGVHTAIDRFQDYARRYPYFLKLDIAQYFSSIDHQLLKQKLARLVGDRSVLALLHTIIDHSPVGNNNTPHMPGDDLVDLMRPRGIPIGNLTSQFFGNYYLNDLDHFLKDQKAMAYIRYMDDFVVFGDSSQSLWALEGQVRAFLTTERLAIHPRKCWVQPSRTGVEFLGYRLWPYRRKLRADNGYQFRRRLKKMARRYKQGQLTLADVRQQVACWQGHAKHGETQVLQQHIFDKVLFSGGNHPIEEGSARRFLEQQSEECAFRQPQQEHHR